MNQQPNNGILVGTWTYRSFISDPDLSTPFNNLEFGRASIRIDPSPMDEFKGFIYGDGWQLELRGSTNYGYPFVVRFQGKGVVGHEEWIYDYLGNVVPPWPNRASQRPAIVGSVVRTIPHSDGTGGVAPAGVVCSWIAVRQDQAA
jgi:hypothetical protein